MAEIFRDDFHGVDEKLFNFKIAFAGFLGIVLTIVFANLHSFETWFTWGILVVTFFTFTLMLIDLWWDIKGGFSNMDEWDNEVVMMANIRATANNHTELFHYRKEAEDRYVKNNKLYQAMEGKKSIDEIVKECGSHRKWKLNFILWVMLFVSVPILFIAQFILYINA